jgi:hypothetical protein
VHATLNLRANGLNDVGARGHGVAIAQKTSIVRDQVVENQRSVGRTTARRDHTPSFLSLRTFLGSTLVMILKHRRFSFVQKVMKKVRLFSLSTFVPKNDFGIDAKLRDLIDHNLGYLLRVDVRLGKLFGPHLVPIETADVKANWRIDALDRRFRINRSVKQNP